MKGQPLMTNGHPKAPTHEMNQTSWYVLLLVFVVQIIAIIVVNGVMFQGRLQQALYVLHSATSGLIDPTLIAGLFMLAVLGAAIFGVGRVTVHDVGWRLRNVLPALAFTVGFWVALQLLLILVITLNGGELRRHEDWYDKGAGFILGGLISQLIGSALLEETVWRGFFLPQFYLKVSRYFDREKALVVALLCSQALFALIHVPHRILHMGLIGTGAFADQPMLFAWALLMAIVYLITRNLFIAVGLHSLANNPTLLVQPPEGIPGVLSTWLTLLLLIGCLCIYKSIWVARYKSWVS